MERVFLWKFNKYNDSHLRLESKNRQDSLAMYEWTETVGNQITVRVGQVESTSPMEWAGTLPDGIRLGVLLSGASSGEIAGKAHSLGSSSTYLLANSGANGWSWRMGPNTENRFSSVTMDLDAAESNGLPVDRLLGGPASQGAILRSTAAGASLQALASQLAVCPLQGSERSLFLAGKALEFTAVLLSGLQTQETAVPMLTSRLSERDARLIHEARDLLCSRLSEPLTLEELGSHVGMSAGKLVFYFRAVFGQTPFTYLREERLKQAFLLISSGRYSVTEVAHLVGYSSAHFATAYKKRFGCSPSERGKKS